MKVETCSHTHTDHFFKNPTCKENPLWKTIAIIAFHIFTLGVFLLIHYVSTRNEQKKIVKSTETKVPEKIPQSLGNSSTLTKPPVVTVPTLAALRNPNAEPSHPMAEKIGSEEEINKLTHLNGVSIQEIEKRAREEANSKFLGDNESLKTVLLNDWKTVRKLGLTHIDIAEQLSGLARKHREKYRPILEQYKIEPQDIECVRLQSKGIQSDIFRPTNSEEYDGGWSAEAHIKNKKNGVTIIWTEGTENYIRQYGFYEGNSPHNHYRVDPIRFMAVLTGLSPESIQKEIDG